MAGISFLFSFCWWSSCSSQTLPAGVFHNPRIFWEGWWNWKTLSSQPKVPSWWWPWRKRQVLSSVMVGIWVLSDICTELTWGSSSAGRGAVAQPWMFFISDQGKPGHPFAVLPVTAASWCSCAFACVYVLLPQDIPAGFFLTEKTASVKISKWLFGAMGVGRISGKKAVLTRTCSSRDSGCLFHSCLLNLESLLLFCYAGRAVNAALAFFLNMFSSGFSSHQNVLFLGEFTQIKPWACGRCAWRHGLWKAPNFPLSSAPSSFPLFQIILFFAQAVFMIDTS